MRGLGRLWETMESWRKSEKGLKEDTGKSILTKHSPPGKKKVHILEVEAVSLGQAHRDRPGNACFSALGGVLALVWLG